MFLTREFVLVEAQILKVDEVADRLGDDSCRKKESKSEICLGRFSGDEKKMTDFGKAGNVSYP